VGQGGSFNYRPPIIMGQRLGNWTYGLTLHGPAAHGRWDVGEYARLDVGVGLDWQGKPRIGVGFRARF